MKKSKTKEELESERLARRNIRETLDLLGAEKADVPAEVPELVRVTEGAASQSFRRARKILKERAAFVGVRRILKG